MFCLRNHLPTLARANLLSLQCFFFSTYISVKKLVEDGSIVQFMSSLYPNSILQDVGLQSKLSIDLLLDTIEGAEIASRNDIAELKIAVDEFQKCENQDANPLLTLSSIASNATLMSILKPSKREIAIVDYFSYYLLSSLITSSTPTRSLETLTAYFMRMQSNSIIRANPLSPSLVQLKPKKMKQSVQVSAAQLSADECMGQLDIRVGRIIKAWDHPDSEPVLRSIGSGIRSFYSSEDMIGRSVCVVCNLKQRTLAGYHSNGMLLCASTSDHSAGALVDPPHDCNVGERIQFDGISREPATPNQVHKKRMFETVVQYLRTSNEGICLYKNIPFSTTTGVCLCRRFPNQSIS